MTKKQKQASKKKRRKEKGKKDKIKFQDENFSGIKEKIKNNDFEKKVIFNFLNSNCVYNYKKELLFRKSLQDNETKQINFIDGFIVSLILSLKKFKRVFRMRGPRFTKLFLEDSELNKNKKHFFIGLDEKKKKELLKNTNDIEEKNVFGYNPPYIKGIEFSKEEIKKIANKIDKSKPNYIWICVGSPKQNILASSLYKKIKQESFYVFNVGAALDFKMKTKKEAPKFIQEIGMEWLYRFLTDFKYSRKKVWRSLLGSFYALFLVDLNKNK